MARPRKSTLDAWLDQFSEWNQEDRAFSLAQIQSIDRALRVAERKRPAVEEPAQQTNGAVQIELAGEDELERARR